MAQQGGEVSEKRGGFYQREACPCCLSGEFKVLCDLPYTDPPIRDYLDAFYSAQGGVEFDCLEGGRYILNECGDCGLIYQKEAPDEHLSTRLYEHWIDPEIVFRTVEIKRDVLYFERMAKEIANVIRFFNVPPGRLEFLDFGMGWGHWCRVAKGFGCNARGMEISNARIEYARASGVEVIRRADLKRRAFDFINTEHVFEHLDAPLEVLMELKGALKPGGVIKINAPNGADIKRRLGIWDWTLPDRHRNSLNPVAPLEHLNCFNHAALCKMAAKAGLAPVRLPDRRPLLLIRSKVKSLLRPLYYFLVGAGLSKNTCVFLRSV